MLTVDEVAQDASPPAVWPTSSFTRGRPRLVPAAAAPTPLDNADNAAAPAPTPGPASSAPRLSPCLSPRLSPRFSPRLSTRLSTRARVSMSARRRASSSGRLSELEGGSSEIGGRSSELGGRSSELEVETEGGAVRRRVSLDMLSEGSLSRHASREEEGAAPIPSSKGVARGGADAGGGGSGSGKGGWSGLVFLMQKIVIPSKREGNRIFVPPKAPMHNMWMNV